jgi:Rps23 Pro-64 3,4-dihydroxylase Tpa1-like proline 4-hydroxylase
MIKNEIAPGIVVYSDVIIDHDSLVNDIEAGILSSGLSWISAGVDGGVNVKVRNTDSISIPFINEIDENFNGFVEAFNKNLANIFYKTLFASEKDYMSDYGVYFSDHDAYQILKYGEGQYFKNHIDDHPSYHRRLSSVYYINDDYQGGEINFPRFNISYKPKANEMIIFPSTYVYNHSVSEVVSGTRYAVVSWIK